MSPPGKGRIALLYFCMFMAVSGVPGAGLRGQEGQVHFCILCEYPVAVYGRVWPCLHTYCLSCASNLPSCSLCDSHLIYGLCRAPQNLQMLPDVYYLRYFQGWPLHHYYFTALTHLNVLSPSRCQTEILRVERVTREQGLHISPATLQSFKSMLLLSPLPLAYMLGNTS